jgi:hypothetical protein
MADVRTVLGGKRIAEMELIVALLYMHTLKFDGYANSHGSMGHFGQYEGSSTGFVQQPVYQGLPSVYVALCLESRLTHLRSEQRFGPLDQIYD